MALFVVSDRKELREIQLSLTDKSRLFHVDWEEFMRYDPAMLLRGFEAQVIVFDCQIGAHVRALSQTLKNGERSAALGSVGKWAYFRAAGTADRVLAHTLYGIRHCYIYSIDPRLPHIVPRFIKASAMYGYNLHTVVTTTLFCVSNSGPVDQLDAYWVSPDRDEKPITRKIHNNLQVAMVVLSGEYRKVHVQPGETVEMGLAELFYRVDKTEKTATPGEPPENGKALVEVLPLRYAAAEGIYYAK